MRLNNFIQHCLHNWPIKIACFSIAVFLSLFYRVSSREERFFSVPLVVMQNKDFVPVNTLPHFIKVHIRGDANKLYPVLESDIHAYIDLSDNEFEGNVRLPVKIRLDGASADIEPLEITVEPMEISAVMEKKIYKTVKVIPGFRGYPENGYEFSGYVITPSSVEVSGPHSVIQAIENIGTKVIDISGRNDSFADSIMLENTNPFVQITGTGKIDFDVRIQETMLVRMFDRLPIVVKHLDSRFVLYADNLYCSLQLKAPQRILENYVPDADTVYISCIDIDKPGVYALPIKTMVPAFAELQKQTPYDVAVTVDFKRETSDSRSNNTAPELPSESVEQVQ